MTEQVKGKYETIVTEEMGKFDAEFTKKRFANKKVSYNDIMIGAGMLAAFYGTGGDSLEANSLTISAAGAAAAIGSFKVDKHTAAYHLAVAGAKQVDKTVDQLKKAELGSKFKVGLHNLNKKAGVIMNKAKTQARMLVNDQKTLQMPIYQGNGDGTFTKVAEVKAETKKSVVNKIFNRFRGKGM